MRLLIRLIVNVIAIGVAVYLLPSMTLSSWTSALIAGVLLGLLNTFVRPVFKFLALPINVATLGLFVLVINAVILGILDWLMTGLEIDSLLWTFIAALVISAITTVVNIVIGEDSKPPRRSRR